MKLIENTLVSEDDFTGGNSNNDTNVAFRPTCIQNFRGQDELTSNLEVYISGARKRNEPLDHVLLYGPPGLGKTTLAEIIANEMGVSYVSLAAPTVYRVGDLASVLVSLEPRSVLFIDEIHRLPIYVEESLYTAMEDYQLDIIVGEGNQSKAITLPINPFTLVGATTKKGMLSTPLLDRFGIPLELRYYSKEDLCDIIIDKAQALNVNISDVAIRNIAQRSRGTPRIAGFILRRVRDFAMHEEVNPISVEIVDKTLDRLGIDQNGLSDLDRRYLSCIQDSFNSGPVGVDTLAASLSEAKETLEVSVEPYLLQQGFLKRTPRGRILGRCFHNNVECVCSGE